MRPHRLAFAMLFTCLSVTAATAQPADPPATGTAETQAADATTKQKVVSITVYGDDPCPEGQDGAIVVCAREPESERYRTPKELRKTPEEPARQSWGSRVSGIEEATKATRPDSCSAVGAGGQTGCTKEMLRQWKAEQRAKKAQARETP